MLGCEQISFECTYGATSVPGETPEISTMTLERMTSQPGSTIKAAALRDFSLFADFSDRELRQLLRLMRRWDLPQGTVVVSEGGPGGSCFVSQKHRFPGGGPRSLFRVVKKMRQPPIQSLRPAGVHRRLRRRVHRRPYPF
jgi:hypothetical protein